MVLAMAALSGLVGLFVVCCVRVAMDEEVHFQTGQQPPRDPP